MTKLPVKEGVYKFVRPYKDEREENDLNVVMQDTILIAIWQNGLLRHSYNPNINTGRWGGCVFQSDTLFCEVIDPLGGMADYSSRLAFQVVSRDSLIWLWTSKLETEKDCRKAIIITPGTIDSIIELPVQEEVWVKSRKWFWCDEKEFKNWKRATQDSQAKKI